MAGAPLESRDVQELRRQHPSYLAAMDRYYVRNAAAMVVDTSFYGLGISFRSHATVLPYFVSQLSHAPLLVGLVPAVYYAGYYLPQLFGAYLVQGAERRKPFIVGIAALQRGAFLLMALTPLLVGHAPAGVVLAWFYLSHVVSSSTDGLMMPAYVDFTAKSIVRSRGRYFTIAAVAGGAAGLAGTYLIRVFLDASRFPTSYAFIFWLALGFSLVSLAAVLTYQEAPFPAPAPRAPWRRYVYSLPEMVRRGGSFSRFVAVQGAVALGTMAAPFFAVYAVDRYQLRPGVIGEFTILMTAAAMAATAWLGHLGDRRGYKVILETAGIASGLAALMMWLVPLPAAAYAAMLLVGAQTGASTLAWRNLLMEFSPPERTASFTGIGNTVLAPFMVMGPLLGGWIVAAFSHSTLFATAAVVSCLAVVASRLFLIDPRRTAVTEGE